MLNARDSAYAPSQADRLEESRTQGQVYGSRTRRMRGHGLFRRPRGLRAPEPGVETPILIEENASRDFSFLLDGPQCLAALRALSPDDWRGLTRLGPPAAERLRARA